MDKEYEIPFGAKDSELKGWEYTIPEGMEAEIKDGKIIVREKDSEDERISKEIITYLTNDFNSVKQVTPRTNEYEGWIAWLEKQGSQNLANSAKTCKVEQKFKDGQWIVWKDKCYKVNYNGCEYELVDQNGLSTSLEYGTIDENAHLWDITKDAKDGDMIYVSTEEKGIQAIFHKYEGGIIYFHCSLCRDFIEGGYMPIGDVEFVYPLQNVHHQRFFEKMKEAGYKWDADKKELKKIEHVAWSEEDENWMNYFEKVLEFAYNNDVHVLGKSCLAGKMWLKSLKERYAWKPSDEQMEALGKICEWISLPTAEILDEIRSLYNDLKKLKE